MKLTSRFDTSTVWADFLSLGSFLSFIFIWAVVTAVGWLDPIFLPSPTAVAKSFWSLIGSHDFLLQHLAASFIRVGCAFLLSVVFALPFAILMSRLPWVENFIEPIFGFTRYLPVAALVPLCILWFGIDDEQKIAVIVLGVVFQLVLLFTFDMKRVPRELVEAGRTFGLTDFEIVRRIILPAALPSLWDDMRVSAGWAWSYLVLAELVAGNRGLGYFIVQSQRYLQIENVFAGILFVGLLGLLTDLLFRLAARRLFRWT